MKIELENDSIHIAISTRGAELVSLLSKDHNLEYIWQANPEIWPRHAPLLFPIVGRLKSNSFQYNGRVYQLSQHGFARDKEFKCVLHDKTSATFQLSADDETLKNYPFNFELVTSYTIEEKEIKIRHQVKNLSSTEMYFSIGAHPGFRCPLSSQETFEDFYLEFEKNETFSRHKIIDGLQSGEQVKLWENVNEIPLKKELFKEDALIFKNLNSKWVKLKSTKNNHSIKVGLEDFPYLGIWTKMAPQADFLCIEPWLGIADHLLHSGDLAQKEGIMKLRGGELYSCSYAIDIT